MAGNLPTNKTAPAAETRQADLPPAPAPAPSSPPCPRCARPASRWPSPRSGCCRYSRQDLEPLIYGEEPFLEAIKRLVLARSYAKVRVLLADPSRAMVDNNRFLALARRLTSCIDLRAMSPEYPASAGAFIIADDKALVYRLQADRWDGISDMNDPAVVRRYLNFFDEVWQTSMQESQMRQMLM